MDMPNIMIVEDESLVGLDIQNNLEDMGFSVSSVHAQASTALAQIPEETPDLILMDIHLRGKMDGVDAAREISQNFDIPVLFLTAFADQDILKRAREVGAYGYMIKPFTNRELRAMVEVAISKHRLDQEKKRLDERIVRAQKNESLRMMAGGLAHRLNNSLQVVIGNLSLIQTELKCGESIESSLKDAKKAADNATELGRQLLACSGHSFLNPETIDLNHFLNKELVSIKGLIPNEIKILLELDPNIPLIEGDTAQLSKVVDALVTNAIEAMGLIPGKITIKSFTMECNSDYLKALRMDQYLEEGLYACFSITDTGCGMDEATVGKMFDPFFTTKFTGRGLGLAAVAGIVQLHKGALKVTSVVGEGTSVVVLLPVANKTSSKTGCV